MAQDAVIDATFDTLIKVVDLLEELDSRVVVRTAIQLAVKATKTTLDDVAVAAAVRVADAIGPNKEKVTAFLNWLRLRAKGVFSASDTLPLDGELQEDAGELAAVAATNWAEAA